MAITEDKDAVHHTSSHVNDVGSRNGSSDREKQATSYLPQSDDQYVVTWKTWCVVWILAWSYGK